MQTVVIVEPHPLFRLGLRQLLSDVLPHISIEGHDYASLQAPAGQPEKCDLLLLSLTSPHTGAKLAADAVQRFSPARILLLADEADLPDSAIGLPQCVAGSVPKEAPPEVLQASVRLVLAGGTCFPAHPLRNGAAAYPMANPAPGNGVRYEPAKWAPSPTVADAGPATLQRGLKPGGESPGDPEFDAPMKPGSAAHRESQLLGLTPRQYEVLVLLARGYPMKKVGRALNISVATAKAHTETLYQRLDVHNRNAAVYAAVSRGATLGWANMPAAAQAGEPST